MMFTAQICKRKKAFPKVLDNAIPSQIIRRREMRCNPPPNKQGEIPHDKFKHIRVHSPINFSRKFASAKAMSLSLWACRPFKVRVAFSVLRTPKILPRPRLHIRKVLFGVAIA
jgi:hypothetical protein